MIGVPRSEAYDCRPARLRLDRVYLFLNEGLLWVVAGGSPKKRTATLCASALRTQRHGDRRTDVAVIISGLKAGAYRAGIATLWVYIGIPATLGGY